MLKRRQLQQQGWNVVPVPYWEFQDADNQHTYMMSALAAMVDPHARAYRLLGVTRETKWEGVKQAYREAAFATHPDRNKR